MGYFDALSSSSFKKDESGRSIFYPWGVLGKGRVLPDTGTESRVRAFVIKYYVISVLVLLVVGVAAGWVFALVLVPFLLLWYHFRSRALTAGFPEAVARLTLKESYAGAARAHNGKVLWLFLVFSILLAAGGLLILLAGSTGYDRIHGAVILLFFGLCAVAIGGMIRARRS